MKSIGVIPARLGSTRLQDKVLLTIAGKPMLQHVWERSKQSKYLDEVIIACDDQKIIDAANMFGAKAVLTSVEHQSGTDRIVEAVKKLDVDIVVNIQGDEPLIDCSIIDNLLKIMRVDESVEMATVIKPINDKQLLENPNVVKVVIDKDGYALYFSRSAIPYNRDQESVEYFKHLGIYAYRKDFLLKFAQMPQSSLEKTEKLEQLRALQNGYKIKTVKTQIETIGVDTAEDFAKVESILGKI